MSLNPAGYENFEYKQPEYGSLGGRGFAESVAVLEPPPALADTGVFQELDAIFGRLRTGVPRLHRDMDELLARIRTPGRQ